MYTCIKYDNLKFLYHIHTTSKQHDDKIFVEMTKCKPAQMNAAQCFTHAFACTYHKWEFRNCYLYKLPKSC